MHPFVTSVLGSLTVVASLSFYASGRSPTLANELQTFFSTSPNFRALSFLALFLCGALFLSVGSARSPLAKFVSWVTPTVGSFTASANGALIGWVSGAAAYHFLSEPLQNAAPAAAVFFLALQLLAAPLFMLYYSALVTISLGDNRFRSLSSTYVRQLRLIQLIGGLMCISMAFFAWQHFNA